MGPTARILPDGARLHLQHGPIDLIIGADGHRARAFDAAIARFACVLDELVGELPALRVRHGSKTPVPFGTIARRMHDATLPLCVDGFVTRMAAVAGAVADEVLSAMTKAAALERAYVNNGGDIALHLARGAQYSTAMSGHDGRLLGRVTLTSQDRIRGIATSGRHGRSLSMGIADSVTVLAESAASADAAATLIGNAVDLPRHSAITRRAAQDVVDDSDLGEHLVVVGCAALAQGDRDAALAAGARKARNLQSQGLICGAALFLQGSAVTTDARISPAQIPEPCYA